MGFIGFYSTLPSSGLTKKLEGLQDEIEFLIYDHEKIEKTLLGSLDGFEIAERYFPNSIKNGRLKIPNQKNFFGNIQTSCANIVAQIY